MTEATCKLVRSWLQSSSHDHLENYLGRGRQFENADIETLKMMWTAAYKEWSRAPTNLGIMQREQDLYSEFILRKLNPPFDLVVADADALSRRVAPKMAELREDASFGEFIEARLLAYVEKKSRGN